MTQMNLSIVGTQNHAHRDEIGGCQSQSGGRWERDGMGG